MLIAGEGGQGVQTIAKILIKAAYDSGKKVGYLPNFGVEQRGGVSLAYIQISDSEIVFPKFDKADFAIILARRAVKRIEKNITQKTKIMFDNSILKESELSDFRVEKIAIPASRMAKEKLIPRVFNTIILGALAEELGFINEKDLKKSLLDHIAPKIKERHEIKHFNLAGLDLGRKTIRDISGR